MDKCHKATFLTNMDKAHKESTRDFMLNLMTLTTEIHRGIK